jgi:hypothetical protein
MAPPFGAVAFNLPVSRPGETHGRRSEIRLDPRLLARDDGGMEETLRAFLDAMDYGVTMLERPEVATHWDHHSVLAEFTVAGLAGHLLRALTTVDTYLDAPPPEGEPVSAVEYYLASGVDADPDSKINRDIRARGLEMSLGGAAAVAAEARALATRLSTRVSSEPLDRPLRVLGGLAITLEDYLRTRIVELLVHADDVALSVGVAPAPAPAPHASTIAIDLLVELARARHGDVSVLRALTRRERDDVDALRVL